jgi:hypothetical protein
VPAEFRQAGDALQWKGAAARHIVPTEQHLSTRFQRLVSGRERFLAVVLVVESPTEDAIADDQVEGARGMCLPISSIVPTMCSCAPKSRFNSLGSSVTNRRSGKYAL